MGKNAKKWQKTGFKKCITGEMASRVHKAE